MHVLNLVPPRRGGKLRINVENPRLLSPASPHRSVRGLPAAVPGSGSLAVAAGVGNLPAVSQAIEKGVCGGDQWSWRSGEDVVSRLARPTRGEPKPPSGGGGGAAFPRRVRLFSFCY